MLGKVVPIFQGQIGHYFTNFGCTKIECPNQRFLCSVISDKKKFLYKL